MPPRKKKAPAVPDISVPAARPRGRKTSANPYWFPATLALMGLLMGYTSGITTQATFARSDTPVIDTVQSSSSLPTPSGIPPRTGVGPAIGDDNAAITIVEFTDFGCPFCVRHFNDVFGSLKTDYVDTGKVRYEVRNLPLTGLHPNAQLAAETAMCAQRQKKYWQMHDMLFVGQAEWSGLADPVPVFKTYAANLKLRTGEFNDCLDKRETKADVETDMSDAAAAGVTGTPGFWILGPDGKTQKIDGAYPYETFKTAFETML